MSIKDILAIIDLEGDRAACRLAASLALATDAHVTGLAPVADFVSPVYIGGPVPLEMIDDTREVAEDRAAAGLKAFDAILAETGALGQSATFSLMEGEGSGLVSVGRLCDLAVVGQDDPEAMEPAREALIETLLIEAGAPVLLTPRAYQGPFKLDKIVIGWDGGLTVSRAVRAALPLLKQACEIHVAVVDSGRGLGEDAGADLALHLARHGFKVQISRLSSLGRDVATTLIEQAVDSDADLIVMGGYGHSRLRQFILGGATSDMMRTMTVPVLMAH